MDFTADAVLIRIKMSLCPVVEALETEDQYTLLFTVLQA
jgi:hypothetical protein